jgi:hypothetical protein
MFLSRPTIFAILVFDGIRLFRGSALGSNFCVFF